MELFSMPASWIFYKRKFFCWANFKNPYYLPVESGLNLFLDHSFIRWNFM